MPNQWTNASIILQGSEAQHKFTKELIEMYTASRCATFTALSQLRQAFDILERFQKSDLHQPHL